MLLGFAVARKFGVALPTHWHCRATAAGSRRAQRWLLLTTPAAIAGAFLPLAFFPPLTRPSRPPRPPQLIRKIEVSQHAKYDCVFCGKKTVTRVSTGIWKCSACKKTSAGGSYVLTTPAAATVRSNIARMRKVAEGAEVVA